MMIVVRPYQNNSSQNVPFVTDVEEGLNALGLHLDHSTASHLHESHQSFDYLCLGRNGLLFSFAQV
jgi:hypothetical protein